MSELALEDHGSRRGWGLATRPAEGRVRLAHVWCPPWCIHRRFFVRLWFGRHGYSPDVSVGRGVLPATGRASLRLAVKGSAKALVRLGGAPAVLGLAGAWPESLVPEFLRWISTPAASGALAIAALSLSSPLLANDRPSGMFHAARNSQGCTPVTDDHRGAPKNV
jgi:hypothetical protein